MNIIILGQQGSGKGTQAEFLAKEMSLIHIDMGKTLREVAKLDTPLGREIYDIQNVTKTLVPSRILREVLHFKLGSIPSEQGIVFDGVPRTMDQSEYMEEALQEFGRKINAVFFINISEAESIKRISKRWICKDCKSVFIMGKDVKDEKEKCPKCGAEITQRNDDTVSGIKKRLQVFAEETMPVINYYKEQGVLVEINGEQEIEKVAGEIIKNIEQI
ncbi:MAG: nucleoside monophosphate kinase [Candidatus Moranbacteria bacterium]|nr:nucleoside monophosphate kinase [Candidatus Moranbacteria bacterium]